MNLLITSWPMLKVFYKIWLAVIMVPRGLVMYNTADTLYLYLNAVQS